jgi:predicted MFS family arabinose efflux permease
MADELDIGNSTSTRSATDSWGPLVLVLGLAGLIVMADNWVVSPLLPSIAAGVHVSVTEAGLLIAAYMLPFGLFQLIFGPLADRVGKLRTITATLAVFGLVTMVGGFMSSLLGLAAVRAMAGIFAASTIPVSLALIGDVVPMQQRQRAIGTFLGIAFLGQGLSMAVGGLIAAATSWRGVFIVYGVLALFVVGVLVRRGGSLPKLAPVAGGSVFGPHRDLLTHWRSLRVYLVALGEGIFILGTFSYLGALLTERHGLGPLGAGLSLTSFGLASVILGRYSGRIAARIGRVNLIGLALALGGVATLLLAELAILPLSIALIFCLGAAFILAHTSVLMIATELAAGHRGVAMSLVAFAFMGGGAVGTMLAGRVIASDGYPTYLLLWGGCLVVLGVAARVALTGADVLVESPASAQMAMDAPGE